MKLSKQVFFVVITIVATFLFLSCEKDVGIGEPPKFDTAPHVFSKKQVDIVIKAKNNVEWWFQSLAINDKPIEFVDPSITCVRDKPFQGADSKLGSIRKFAGDWFAIEKIDNKQIRIVLKENEEGEKRNLEILLQAGDAFREISVVQQP